MTPQRAGDLILAAVALQIGWAFWRAWRDEQRARAETRRQLRSMSRHRATMHALGTVPPPAP